MEELSSEFKKAYGDSFREKHFKVLIDAIFQLADALISNKKVQSSSKLEEFKIQLTYELITEIAPIYILMTKIKEHGLPKSLVLINKSGEAIDLLEVKELTQEAAFNELLDNMKIG
ncbi:MAG: hypothetical protein A2066_08085 [Bacteroidetes bacterium GWB2_41_8]|nr:MAG: hypothetical protein A2066_08085 [Bacteroidetes bacterium GWB2_41_8]